MESSNDFMDERQVFRNNIYFLIPFLVLQINIMIANHMKITIILFWCLLERTVVPADSLKAKRSVFVLK